MKAQKCITAIGGAGVAVVAAIAAFALSLVIAGGAPATALAADGSALSIAAAPQLSAQATTLASADPVVIDKKAVANAKTMVKNAKATSGTARAKLKNVYKYVATDKKWGGAFAFEIYPTFWSKAKGDEKTQYYASAAGPKTMKGLYKKYAIDAFKLKKASCYHYAALFAVAAKQAIGSKGTVKIAVGTAKMKKPEGDTYWNPHHSWVEVKLGTTTYVYDTQQGNYYSKSVGKKTGFGKYCGSKKSTVKKTYKSYKGAKYATVTL